MRTLKQYNQDFLEENNSKKASQYSTGIACDNCGTELTYSQPGIILTSYPGQKRVHCTKCNFTGTVYCNGEWT